MDVRVGLWRKLSAEELILLNCGVGDSQESLGLQGYWTSPSLRKSVLTIHRKDWCWSWNPNNFGHLMWRTESLEKTLMLGKIEGERRRGRWGWDCWIASPTQWTWVWVNSGSWLWTVKPGVLQSMGSQRVGHTWMTELNWTLWDNNILENFLTDFFPLFLSNNYRNVLVS